MTHLCYTLEEAADKLKLTETVLVRLSQYFKVPRAAYEESGYLSFKGDLAFTEQDIDFFRQAKERLLLGESLEEVRNRIREPIPSGVKPEAPAQDSRFAGHLSQAVMEQPSSMKASSQALSPSVLPMREIQDRQPYEKAAEQSFERYKSVHRTGLGRVFENMLKEVGTTRGGKKPAASPDLRPMKAKSGEKLALERSLPFQRGREELAQDVQPSRRVIPKRGAAGDEPSWEQLLKQAVHQPRSLNSHLKGAAALLRERAIGQQTAGPKKTSR